jgi:phage terminase small subunit
MAKQRPAPPALNPRQERFAREYAVDHNATQSAIRAGYSPKTAHVQGPRLLGNARVSRLIASLDQKAAAKLELDAQWVLGQLHGVSQKCQQAQPVMVFDRASKTMVPAVDEDGKAIYEFDSSGANRSLELIGKHLGMFTERVEHSGPGGGPIQTINAEMTPKQAAEAYRALLAHGKV